jgi:hypothetical protein
MTHQRGVSYPRLTVTTERFLHVAEFAEGLRVATDGLAERFGNGTNALVVRT